jgi:nucleoside-diphosphate-sugar epimerase
MIVGSGLLAKAFIPMQASLGDVCIYAAGVSNSFCSDESEYKRDSERLQNALANTSDDMLFVYFSTCSILDPGSSGSRYTQHKSQLEAFVRRRRRFLVARLPQVAGRTPNPHTILNYLYARVTRSERFDLWRRARRNIIDVEDVAKITMDLLAHGIDARDFVNIANSRDYSLEEIVAALETTTQHAAVFTSIDKGAEYRIDTSAIAASVDRCGISFDDGYLLRTLEKYYV